MMKISKKGLLSLILVLASVIGILAVIGSAFKVYGLAQNFHGRIGAKEIDRSTYQAVFLNNNQVYFGLLKNIDSQYPTLTDVYYVQLNEIGQEANDQSPNPKGKLVALGKSEPHGPTNKMIINRDQILFVENLRSDSQVLKIIQSLKQTD